MLKSLIEIKYSIQRIKKNYIASKYKLKFFLIYSISLLIVGLYFTYVISVFIFIFLYVSLTGIINLFWLKNKFNLRCMYIYDANFGNSILNIFKYYLIDIIIQYAYLIFYLILKILTKNIFLDIIRSIFGRLFNILFIFLFGFPSFLINVVTKLYVRIDNSTEGYWLYINVLLMNLNSMYFFDFKETVKFEDYYITYKENTINFN